MQRAIALARRGLGRTRPNPPVGAVVVRDGEIVGEGYHHRAGGRHAERIALDEAGELARGATVHVTLEPCAHAGRTPPCTEALIAAGVREVVYGWPDPNPTVAGGGHARLEEAGVEVRASSAAEACYRLAQPFFHWATLGRPLVLAKFAMSLDGKIATAAGDSRWISNPASRDRGHELRDRHDAILVGAGTVEADDPLLTTRLDGREVRHPVRIVADSRGATAGSRLFCGELPGLSVLATTIRADIGVVERLCAAGHGVWVLPSSRSGGVDLRALLERAASEELTSVLVEGGGTLLGSLFDEDLVDRVAAFVAPMVVGGSSAPLAVAGRGVRRLAEARRAVAATAKTVDGDLWFEGELRRLPRRTDSDRSAHGEDFGRKRVHRNR